MFTPNYTNYLSLFIDNYIPYIAFGDSSNLNKASIMKFNGTNWEYIKYHGFSSSTVDI
ncbi:MAG: hypothetical protein N3A58_08355 [Spirochaetes bacterium]|nr:hypothetical protein [Spirochaetota bacterium]